MNRKVKSFIFLLLFISTLFFSTTNNFSSMNLINNKQSINTYSSDYDFNSTSVDNFEFYETFGDEDESGLGPEEYPTNNILNVHDSEKRTHMYHLARNDTQKENIQEIKFYDHEGVGKEKEYSGGFSHDSSCYTNITHTKDQSWTSEEIYDIDNWTKKENNWFFNKKIWVDYEDDEIFGSSWIELEYKVEQDELWLFYCIEDTYQACERGFANSGVIGTEKWTSKQEFKIDVIYCDKYDYSKDEFVDSSELNYFVDETNKNLREAIARDSKVACTKNSTTYYDIEEYLKNSIVSRDRVPLEMTDFYFYDNEGHAIEDKNQYINSNKINVKLKPNSSASSNIIGESDIITYTIPYIEEIYFEDDLTYSNINDFNYSLNYLNDYHFNLFFNSSLNINIKSNLIESIYFNGIEIDKNSENYFNIKIDFNEKEYYELKIKFYDYQCGNNGELNLTLYGYDKQPFFDNDDISSDGNNIEHKIAFNYENPINLFDYYFSQGSILIDFSNCSNILISGLIGDKIILNKFNNESNNFELYGEYYIKDLNGSFKIYENGLYELKLIDKIGNELNYYIEISSTNSSKYSIMDFFSTDLGDKLFRAARNNGVKGTRTIETIENTYSAFDVENNLNYINGMSDLNDYVFDEEKIFKDLSYIEYGSSSESVAIEIRNWIYDDLIENGYEEGSFNIKISGLDSTENSTTMKSSGTVDYETIYDIEITSNKNTNTYGRCKINFKPIVSKNLAKKTIDNDKLIYITNLFQDKVMFKEDNLLFTLNQEIYNQLKDPINENLDIDQNDIDITWFINDKSIEENDTIKNGDKVSYVVRAKDGNTNVFNTIEGSFTSRTYRDLSEIIINTLPLQEITWLYKDNVKFGKMKHKLEDEISNQLSLRKIDSSKLTIKWYYSNYIEDDEYGNPLYGPIYSLTDDIKISNNMKIYASITSLDEMYYKEELKVEFVAQNHYNLSKSVIDLKPLYEIMNSYDFVENEIKFYDVRVELEKELDKQLKSQHYNTNYITYEWNKNDEEFVIPGEKITFEIRSSNKIYAWELNTYPYEILVSDKPIEDSWISLEKIIEIVVIILVITLVLLIIYKIVIRSFLKI